MLNTSVESTSSHRSVSPILDEWTDTYGAEISKLSETRQAQYRTRLMRRKQNETTSRIELDCDDHTLQVTALHKFLELIDRSDTSSIYCFKVILNSLYGYFSINSHGCSLSDCPTCKESVGKFLNSIYLEEFAKSCIKAGQAKNGKAEQAFRQREVIALLSLHKLRYFPQPIEKVKIGEHLKFLYFNAGSERLKSFLDTTFTDEFFLDLPFYIAAVYDDIGLICPNDIEEYKSYDGENNNYEEISFKENNWAGRLDEFISSLNVDDDEDKQTEQFSITMASTSKEQIQSVRTIKALKNVYPETPVKKRKSLGDDIVAEDQKVIKQTPISKIHRVSAASMDRNLQTWSNVTVEKTAKATLNRKRPNNFSQNSIHTKKQKAADNSVRPSCYNLSILFANFQ